MSILSFLFILIDKMKYFYTKKGTYAVLKNNLKEVISK